MNNLSQKPILGGTQEKQIFYIRKTQKKESFTEEKQIQAQNFGLKSDIYTCSNLYKALYSKHRL